ncbi:hypothetical protein IX324_000008 [Bacteroides pyogenes]|nr:hypothetical protein [Bacteroides pyogenes]
MIKELLKHGKRRLHSVGHESTLPGIDCKYHIPLFYPCFMKQKGGETKGWSLKKSIYREIHFHFSI